MYYEYNRNEVQYKTSIIPKITDVIVCKLPF